MVKVSVIIPVFNAESYLAECLNSVINQTFHNIEIICIDDASTDNSANILREYERKDSRVTVLQNGVNKGQSYARNAGMEKALGDYILFVDSDDHIEKNLISIAVENMGQVDMVCFDYREIDEVWNGVDRHLFCIKSGVYKAKDFFSEAVNTNSVIYSPWSKLYRREFLIKENIRFIDGIIYEDVAFHFLCMIKAGYIYCIPDKLYTYRVRNSSTMTKKINGKNVMDYFQVFCYISRIFLENDFDTEMERTIEKYIQHVYWWLCNAYRKYSFENNAYALKSSISKKRYAKLYGVFSEITSGSGEIPELSEEQFRLLKNSRHILIYGAGNIARDVINVFDRYDISIDGIAVSGQSDNRKSLLGNRIQEITHYTEKKDDSLVVIATSARFYTEIETKLRELGFLNYMELF